MTVDQVSTVAERAARAQARRALILAPLMLLFTVLGVAVIWTSDPGSWVGWMVLLLFCPGLLILPLIAVRGFRRVRWTHGPLVARRLTLDSAATLMFCAAYAGLFAWMTWLARASHEWAWVALAATLSVAFLLLTFSGLRLLFDTRPLVVVDGAGYFDRRSMRRPIPWNKMDHLESRSVQGRTIFYLVANEQDSNRRLMKRLDPLVGIQGFSVNAMLIDHCLADLFLAIHHHAPRLFDARGGGVVG